MSPSSAIAVSSAWVSTGLLRKRQCGIEVFTIAHHRLQIAAQQDRGYLALLSGPQLLQHIEPGEGHRSSDNRK